MLCWAQAARAVLGELLQFAGYDLELVHAGEAIESFCKLVELITIENCTQCTHGAENIRLAKVFLGHRLKENILLHVSVNRNLVIN